MKAIAVAALAVPVLVPWRASAQNTQVFTDRQGVETYTNLPASRRAKAAPAKDRDGVELYTNVPPSQVGNHRNHPEPLSTAGEDVPAFSVVPAARIQEPPPARAEAQGAPSESGTPSVSDSSGQWVYTQQYGWVWMPYGARYVSEGAPGDDSPYAYVYDSSDGWAWLPAPWVWGWGPYPYFGARGPGRFGWYTGLVHAGYRWGAYRSGGPGHVGFTRGLSQAHSGSAGGHFGRGFAIGGPHAGPAARRGYSGGGSLGGSHAGGHAAGFGGGHGGGRGGGRR